jgi:microcystin-dependent protein
VLTTPKYALPYPQESDSADVPRDVQALAQRIEVVLPNVGIPTGMGADWYATAAPAGFLLCDGSAVNRTTYAALFAVIGTAWGGGDGINTFNLPDCRGRVIVGVGTQAEVNALAANDGTPVASRRVRHAHTNGLTANHNIGAGHNLTLPDHRHVNVSRNGASNSSNSDYKSGTLGDGSTGGGSNPDPINQTAGQISSAPAINGGVQINGGVTLSGTIGVTGGTADGPSYVVANKVIKS